MVTYVHSPFSMCVDLHNRNEVISSEDAARLTSSCIVEGHSRLHVLEDGTDLKRILEEKLHLVPDNHVYLPISVDELMSTKNTGMQLHKSCVSMHLYTCTNTSTVYVKKIMYVCMYVHTYVRTHLCLCL